MISLDDLVGRFQGLQTTKQAGLRVDRVPSKFGFEPRSPRYGPFLVLGWVDTRRARSMPFWANFWLFLRHIVELEGNKGPFVTRESRRTCNVATVSPHLAVLNGFWGRLGPEKAVLGHKMRSFGRGPPALAPPPRGGTVEFLAQNLDLARAQTRL